MEVWLFVPCYVDQLAPDVGLATLRVLERAGCTVHYDSNQSCCGQPFINMGATQEARRLIALHLERFAEADAVVCPSASCVSAVRHRYADLARPWGESQRKVSQRTFELGEFLVRRLGVTDLGARFSARVALLESCHGLRDLGLGSCSERGPASEPGVLEQLLKQVQGLELVRPERPDECCGFGGLFSVQFPEISARIGRARLRMLAETDAEFVTASDVSCLLHLDGIRRREGFGPRPIHLAEILASGASG